MTLTPPVTQGIPTPLVPCSQVKCSQQSVVFVPKPVYDTILITFNNNINVTMFIINITNMPVLIIVLI